MREYMKGCERDYFSQPTGADATGAARTEDKAKHEASRRERAKRALAECSNRLAFTPFECGVVLGKSATYIYR